MNTVSPGELVVGEVLLLQDLAVMRLPPMRARRIPCMCDVRSRDILTYEWTRSIRMILSHKSTSMLKM